MPMLDLNPAAIAKWPTPNYENPVVRGPAFPIFGGLFFFCATLATLATTTCVNLGTSRYDWNKHLWDVRPSGYTVKAYWSWPPMPNAYCIKDGVSMEVIAVINTLMEVFIAILPIIATFQLQVDPRQRWGVIALLSMGFLVAIAGVIRTVNIFKLLESYDLTWWSGPQWLASEIEIDIALIGACAAPLRPVVTRFCNRIRGLPAMDLASRSKKNSHASPSPGPGTQSSLEFDHEAVTSWQQQHARTIDLEGIKEDGLGYSVVISGPTKRKRLRKPNLIARKGTDSLLQSGRAFQRIRSPLMSPDTEPIAMDLQQPKPITHTTKSIPLQVTTEKSFQVTESFKEVVASSGKSSRMGSISLPREPGAGATIEQAANLAGLGNWQVAEAYGDYDDQFKPEPPPK
ncbi:hypothetical protein FKW77_001358 [Venturia effusa]|uniref:Rhodopsin domain-containing protein n=1 Tax=Venturia effusa TaxID=50376 RepID=A0A517L8L8_9PEZI|nr:hypothetical protein FKW77_001358 [Venturia effusa]